MSSFVRAFLKDQHGGPAAEFALVVPILFLFLFGIIDAGRFMWTLNRAEKATQMGARYAATNNIIPGGTNANGLMNFSYSSNGIVTQGFTVPQSQFGGIKCTSTACTCKNDGGICPGALVLTRDAAAFNNVVTRMALFLPGVAAANVEVDYDYSGLGFAGDPNGPDVAPLVTVRLKDIQFSPIVLLGFRMKLPGFSTTLSLEDGTDG